MSTLINWFHDKNISWVSFLQNLFDSFEVIVHEISVGDEVVVIGKPAFLSLEMEPKFVLSAAVMTAWEVVILLVFENVLLVVGQHEAPKTNPVIACG